MYRNMKWRLMTHFQHCEILPENSALKIFYADEDALLKRNIKPAVVQEKLQHDVDLTTCYYCKWKLKLNPSKSATFLYQLGPRKPDMKSEIKNEHIRPTTAFKSLGVALDRSFIYKRALQQNHKPPQKQNNLSWNAHWYKMGCPAYCSEITYFIASPIRHENCQYEVWKNPTYRRKKVSGKCTNIEAERTTKHRICVLWVTLLTKRCKPKTIWEQSKVPIKWHRINGHELEKNRRQSQKGCPFV